MKLSELTKYKEVYATSYWGQCEHLDEDNCGHQDVITNRNEFIEKYDISIPCHSDSYNLTDILGKKCFDHCELYKTNTNNIILITSYYKNKINNYNTYKETMSIMGFFITNCMYHPLAESWVQEFENEKEFENFLILYG